FGLSRQSFSSWLKDYAKSLVLGSIISLVMILILYSFLRSFGSFWWVYVALVYFFFSIVLAKIFPVIIIPLFYKLDKIEEAPLKDQLMALARKTGVEVLDVYKIALGEKTKKANAALCGLGATKRILLSDTLIENYTADEIAGTLAHELAHYKRRHFWKLSLLNFFLTLVGCGILNLILSAAVFNGIIGHAYEIGAFPLIITVFILYNIITLPLSNHISCRFETEADMLALGMTGKPAAFCDLLNKLSRQNLSDPHPSAIIKLFFYDHPPAAERIKACRRKADA
ncbi:MAG: M48 family metalloprotease, partial [Candidatus Omnitrophica bacterium]|nr:M48 family metalloprotease [Candidatus Omnitrophota bacterium]